MRSDARDVEFDDSDRDDQGQGEYEQPRSRQLAQPASYTSPPNLSYDEDENQVVSEDGTRDDEYDESEEEGPGSEREEQPRVRHLAQPASHSFPPNMSSGHAGDAIEVIDSSDEESQGGQPQQRENAGSGSEEGDEADSEMCSEVPDQEANDDEVSPQERIIHAQGEEFSEGEYDNDGVGPPHLAESNTQRPSDYDMSDDESRGGYESDVEGADEGLDLPERPDQTQSGYLDRQASKDELAEDDEDQQSDTEMAHVPYPERPRVMLPRQSEGAVALDIDPSLHSEYVEEVQPVQMDQVSAQSVVVSGLLQMAQGLGSQAAAIPGVFENAAAAERAQTQDTHVLPETLDASLSKEDAPPIQAPEDNDSNAQVQMTEVSIEAFERDSSAQRSPVAESVFPETFSAPELTRSAILSDLPTARPASAITEYEADNELLPEAAPSAAPSLSTFSPTFADTPLRPSPTRDSLYVDDAAADGGEVGEEHPAVTTAMTAGQPDEEPRTQETMDVDVDASEDVVSVRSVASVAEGRHPAASSEAGDGSGKSPSASNSTSKLTHLISHALPDALSDGISSQDPVLPNTAPTDMAESREVQDARVSDGEQPNIEKRESHAYDDAQIDDREVDGDEMDTAHQSGEQESDTEESAQGERSTSASPAVASESDGMGVDLPQPVEIPARHDTHDRSRGRNELSASDIHANHSRLKTPSDDQDDVLEDVLEDVPEDVLEEGEIRDEDDPVFPPREASPAERGEAIDAIAELEVETVDAASRDSPIQLEIDVEVDIEVEVAGGDMQTDRNADGGSKFPET